MKILLSLSALAVVIGASPLLAQVNVQTSSVTKRVTVTSDGNRTIKKTVIIRDGVEEVTTEITDAHGNTTTVPNSKTAPKAKPETKKNAWLGLRVQKVSPALRAQLGLPENQGALIDEVAAEGPAAEAGIKKGDLLLSIDEKAIGNAQDVKNALKDRKADEKASLATMRGGQKETVEVTLGERAEVSGKIDPLFPVPDILRPDRAGDGQAQIQIQGGDFDSILENPNIPEEFKQTVRDMRKQIEEFRRTHKRTLRR